MMRHGFFTTGFPLFHAIVQEEVDQDRVDLRFGMLTKDFTPDKLNAPDAAACTSRQ